MFDTNQNTTIHSFLTEATYATAAALTGLPEAMLRRIPVRELAAWVFDNAGEHLASMVAVAERSHPTFRTVYPSDPWRPRARVKSFWHWHSPATRQRHWQRRAVEP